MGLGLVASLALAGAAVTTVATVRAQRKAEAAQREGRAVQSASNDFSNIVQRRRAAKEERVRRARIRNAAETSNVSGSSGESGAISAVASNTGSALAFQSSQQSAFRGINAANQRAADARSSGRRIQAFGGLFQEALGLYNDYTEFV